MPGSLFSEHRAWPDLFVIVILVGRGGMVAVVHTRIFSALRRHGIGASRWFSGRGFDLSGQQACAQSRAAAKPATLAVGNRIGKSVVGHGVFK